MRGPNPTPRLAARLLVLALGLAWACAPTVASARRGRGTPVPPVQAFDEPVQENVRLVLLPASVTDRRGTPVRGLEADDFRLFEAGQLRRIDVFATETDLPISLAFVLDVSGSMGLGRGLERAKAAIEEFVMALGPRDRVGLICFADKQVTWVTEFTSDRDRFLERLRVQTAEGQTAVFDALAAIPSLVDREQEGRKAIILFTDGQDNASGHTSLDAALIARRVPVPIHIISFIPMSQWLLPPRVRLGLRVLERFSVETGGELYAIHDAQDLISAVARIQDQTRFQYVIGFYSPDHDWDGSFRPIALESQKARLTIRTRSGYYAEP